MKTEIEWLKEQLEWLEEYRFKQWGDKPSEIEALDHTAWKSRMAIKKRIKELEENGRRG